MSLIQDALRRKLDEQRVGLPSGPAAPAKAPPQTPLLAQQVMQQESSAATGGRFVSSPPPHGPEVRPRARAGAGRRDDQFTIWLLVTAILVMLTAAFVGALMFFVNAQHLRLTATSIHPSNAASELQPPAPLAVQDETPAAEEPPPEAAALNPAWPTIRVGGVLTGGRRSRASALLNGEMIKVNYSLNGVRLVSLTEDGVTLEYRGEQRFVETGRSTDP